VDASDCESDQGEFKSHESPQKFEVKEMPYSNKDSKSNTTAASQAHTPESKPYLVDQIHSRNYPGKKAPKAEKVLEAQHNSGALASGRGNSLGVSANGSHKGLPSSYDYVGHDGYNVSKEAGITSPALPEGRPEHEPAKLAAGKKNSIGVSADGSHKSFPGKVEQIGQESGKGSRDRNSCS
jgi:hypothetical protein